jgi:hypothetical protein
MVFSFFFLGSDFLSFGYLTRRTREEVIDAAFENRSFNSKSKANILFILAFALFILTFPDFKYSAFGVN